MVEAARGLANGAIDRQTALLDAGVPGVVLALLGGALPEVSAEFAAEPVTDGPEPTTEGAASDDSQQPAQVVLTHDVSHDGAGGQQHHGDLQCHSDRKRAHLRVAEGWGEH